MSDVNDLDRLKKILEKTQYLVFFGGAGVSTESDIPDFRSQDGLYHTKYDYPPEQILSHTFFKEHPDIFYRFYREKMIYRDAKPNDAHIALAKLEQEGKLKAIITQNIDNLHQLAGSKKVLELHGTVAKNHCLRCHQEYSLDDIMKSDGIPYCPKCHGIIKPDVVLYEEALSEKVLMAAINEISKCDTLIIGGTSLRVYPAAGLVRYFQGKSLVIINKEETQYQDVADLIINDKIGKVLKAVV